MSLILEALKKAERQHMLGEVPRISAESEQPSSAVTHRFGWLMMGLLALILLGIGIYLGSNWLSPQMQQQEPPVSHRAPVITPPPQALTETRPTMPPAPAIEAQPAIPPAPAIEAQPEIAAPPAKEIDQPPVVEAQPPPAPAPTQAPKPLHEMPSGFVANLPSLSIDIHSYDKQPAKRYVLINMEKYREGDYLADGPRVIEILPDGAVMEHMGERFILPIGN
jgi:general secretion pathway protein B